MLVMHLSPNRITKVIWKEKKDDYSITQQGESVSKMPGYLCVFYISTLEKNEKENLLEMYSFFANITLLREAGVRREGMSQSIIFLILANLTWFFNALNIPLWNVSQLQCYVPIR